MQSIHPASPSKRDHSMLHDYLEIKEYVTNATEWHKENMTEDIVRLISLANTDLYSGPVYLDSEGGSVSYFDDYVECFDFQGACQKIRTWAEDIDDIVMGGSIFEDHNEVEWSETVEGSRGEILKAIVGSELYRYIS